MWWLVLFFFCLLVLIYAIGLRQNMRFQQEEERLKKERAKREAEENMRMVKSGALRLPVEDSKEQQRFLLQQSMQLQHTIFLLSCR